jgi:hypothetical protein
VKIKAFCGALVSTVAAASAVAATGSGIAAYQANLVDQAGVEGPVTVVTYKGKDALPFLPSLRAHLQDQAASGGDFAGAAKERLHSLDTAPLTAFQVTIITPSVTNGVGTGIQPMDQHLPAPGFPLNPTSGQIVGTQGCFFSGGGIYAEDDAWQYQTAANGVGNWVPIRNNTWRVTTCPYATIGV